MHQTKQTESHYYMIIQNDFKRTIWSDHLSSTERHLDTAVAQTNLGLLVSLGGVDRMGVSSLPPGHWLVVQQKRQHVNRKKWDLGVLLRSRRSCAPSCLEWTLVEGCASSSAPRASCRHSAALWAWRRPAAPTEAWWARAAAQLPPEETTAQWWGRSRVEQIYCPESMPSLQCTEKQQLSMAFLSDYL